MSELLFPVLMKLARFLPKDKSENTFIKYVVSNRLCKYSNTFLMNERGVSKKYSKELSQTIPVYKDNEIIPSFPIFFSSKHGLLRTSFFFPMFRPLIMPYLRQLQPFFPTGQEPSNGSDFELIVYMLSSLFNRREEIAYSAGL